MTPINFSKIKGVAVNSLNFKHFKNFRPQKGQADELPSGWENLTMKWSGPAWAISFDGQVAALAGILETAPQTWFAWAVLGEGSGAGLLTITRLFKDFLKNFEKPLYIVVNPSWPAAVKWAGFLGFRQAMFLEPFSLWLKD